MQRANHPTFAPDFGPEPRSGRGPKGHFPEMIGAERIVHGKPLGFLAKTDDWTLANAIAALVAASDIEQPLAQAHTAAEEALQALHHDPKATEVQKAKAERAEAKAEAAYIRAHEKLEKAAAAVLAVSPSNATDALLQQRAFAWAHDAADATEVPFEGDLRAALKSVLWALRRMTMVPPPAASPGHAGPSQQLVKAWREARAAYHAAFDASRALEASTFTPEEEEASLDAVAEAMEAWESLPPPGLHELVEVMLASLDFNGFKHRWDNSRDPRSWRDLLDSSDTFEIFAARYALHAMRLCRGGAFELHPALSVVPSADLYQPFDPSQAYEGDEPEAIHRAWTEHHDAIWRGEFPPCGPARANIDRWWRVILNDPAQKNRQATIGVDNVSAGFDAGKAMIAAE